MGSGMRFQACQSRRAQPSRSLWVSVVVVVALAVVGCGGSGAALGTGPVAATALWTGLSPAEVDQLAAALVEGGHCKSVVVGLIDEHSELWRGYGEGPPTDETLYEIGSVTKVFTGLLLAQAQVKGVATLDEAVTALLPEGVSTVADADAVTLKMLSSHTSGLPRLPTNWEMRSGDDPYASYDADALKASLGGTALKRSERTGEYLYSNFGAGLLGYALSERAGMPYEDLLRAWIFDPVELSHTLVRMRGDDSTRLAQGYNSDGEPVGPWRFDALEGAGAVRSTVGDMIHFVRLNLVPERVPELEAAVRLTHAPVATRLQGEMGLGWHIGLGVEGGAQVLWHNGETGGYHAFIAFDPQRLKGVVVLAAGASAQVDLLGSVLLQRLRGLPPPAFELPPPSVPVEPSTLKDYVGVYSVTLMSAMEVTQEEDRLYARMSGQARARIFPAADGRFYYRAVQASIVFQRDAAGQVTGLVLHQNGNEVPAAKVKAQPTPSP
jgi:D-alanyl-D-alanine-carboxypeptidase/D-alanyl-D-alanine-endopeptidase